LGAVGWHFSRAQNLTPYIGEFIPPIRLACRWWHGRCSFSAARGSIEPREIKLATLKQKEKATMLWTILVVLLVLWLIGAIGGIGGGLIHLLLVVALIIFVINLLAGRRTV
jgi:hypothetical protein